MPKIAKHEPFSYAAILSAFKEVNKLFADVSVFQQRLHGRGCEQIKTEVKAFIIDLEFFKSQLHFTLRTLWPQIGEDLVVQMKSNESDT